MLALDDFTRYRLNYEVTTGHTTDGKGNRVPVTEPRVLDVCFKPKAAARMVYQVGADVGEMSVEGACFSPRLMPPEIVNGQEFDFDFGGRAAKLTIQLLPRRNIAELDEEFGQKWEGVVKT